MPISIGEAAVFTGRSRNTILRAIKSKKLSEIKERGRYFVDETELGRVFKVIHSRAEPSVKAENEHLRAMLEEVRASREEVRATLDDLRRERDDLRKERDFWRAQAERLAETRPTRE